MEASHIFRTLPILRPDPSILGHKPTMCKDMSWMSQCDIEGILNIVKFYSGKFIEIILHYNGQHKYKEIFWFFAYFLKNKLVSRCAIVGETTNQWRAYSSPSLLVSRPFSLGLVLRVCSLVVSVSALLFLEHLLASRFCQQPFHD